MATIALARRRARPIRSRTKLPLGTSERTCGCRLGDAGDYSVAATIAPERLCGCGRADIWRTCGELAKGRTQGAGDRKPVASGRGCGGHRQSKQPDGNENAKTRHPNRWGLSGRTGRMACRRRGLRRCVPKYFCHTARRTGRNNRLAVVWEVFRPGRPSAWSCACGARRNGSVAASAWPLGIVRTGANHRQAGVSRYRLAEFHAAKTTLRRRAPGPSLIPVRGKRSRRHRSIPLGPLGRCLGDIRAARSGWRLRQKVRKPPPLVEIWSAWHRARLGTA